MNNRVKEVREEMNITQEDLANRVGISRTYLSEIETGKRKAIGGNIMFNIAIALNKDVSDIFF